MRTLQPPIPNKITEPFLSTGSVLSELSFRKGPYGDCFNLHHTRLLCSTKPGLKALNFPESHRITASSVCREE